MAEPDLNEITDDGLCGYGGGKENMPRCTNPTTAVITWDRTDEDGSGCQSNTCTEHLSLAVEKYQEHIIGIVVITTKEAE